MITTKSVNSSERFLLPRVLGLVFLLGAASLGGVAGGLVTEWRRAPVKQLAKAEAFVKQKLQDVEEFDERLQSMERAVSELQRERKLLALVRGKVEANAAPVGSGVASDSPPKVDDQVFDEAVRSVYEKVEAEKAAERQEEELRRAAQRWAHGIAQQFSLDDTQKSEVNELAVEYSQRAQPLLQSEGADDATDRAARSARITALRDQYEQRLGHILDARQMESYRALDVKFRLGSEFKL